jgi:hypothetical protein
VFYSVQNVARATVIGDEELRRFQCIWRFAGSPVRCDVRASGTQDSDQRHYCPLELGIFSCCEHNRVLWEDVRDGSNHADIALVGHLGPGVRAQGGTEAWQGYAGARTTGGKVMDVRAQLRDVLVGIMQSDQESWINDRKPWSSQLSKLCRR